MPRTKKVYAVSDGEYSYYSVDAIFPTRAAADAYLRKLVAAGGSGFVESFPLYDEPPPMYRLWRVQTYVHAERYTRTFPISGLPVVTETSEAVVGGRPPRFQLHVTPLRGGSVHDQTVTNHMVTASGLDLERCRKAVAEKVGILRAEAAGIT